MVNALIRPSRAPAAADRALLDRLYRHWRDQLLPEYRALATRCSNPAQATTADLADEIDLLGRTAGRHLWYLAVVGGSAWKMERALTNFLARHGPTNADVPALLRGLVDIDTRTREHAVYGLDWYHPTATTQAASDVDPVRGANLRQQRADSEATCRRHLSNRPRLVATFIDMLAATQKYAAIREQQSRDLTLAWPRLRDCVLQLGQRVVDDGLLDDPSDIFFLTHDEVAHTGSLTATAADRRVRWERQRRLNAPLAIGTPPPIIGRHLEQTLGLRRPKDPDALLTGQPASAGRATGPARIVDHLADVDHVRPGDILIARATSPSWTPLFNRIAGIVTDGGTAAAHASLIAREYGIPAVVGTQTATTRLSNGQPITVDGTRGHVIQAEATDF